MIDRVALFVTCLADTLFPEVGKATVTVLERLGIEVVFPVEQTCCGQMHGELRLPGRGASCSRAASSRSSTPYDAVVTPSGSCAAQVREHYPGLLGGDDRRRARRERWELSQFLTGVLGVEDVGSTLRGHGHLPPDLPLAAAAAGRRRAAAAAARRARASSSSSSRRPRSAAASAARSRSRTPTSRRRCSTRSWRRSSPRAPTASAPATARA